MKAAGRGGGGKEGGVWKEGATMPLCALKDVDKHGGFGACVELLERFGALRKRLHQCRHVFGALDTQPKMDLKTIPSASDESYAKMRTPSGLHLC